LGRFLIAARAIVNSNVLQQEIGQQAGSLKKQRIYNRALPYKVDGSHSPHQTFDRSSNGKTHISAVDHDAFETGKNTKSTPHPMPGVVFIGNWLKFRESK
jgi:hypothetical protein